SSWYAGAQQARLRHRGARRRRAPPRAVRPTTSPRSHELAEAVADKCVEVDRQLTVRIGEVAEKHEEIGAILVDDRIRYGCLARQPLEVPEVPLARFR